MTRLAVEDTNAKLDFDLVDFVANANVGVKNCIDSQLVSKIYLRKNLSTKKSYCQIIYLPKMFQLKTLGTKRNLPTKNSN